MSPDLDFSRLRTLREERGWSLRQLAVASDVSPSYLSLVERGKTVPTLTRIMRVCETLGVSLGDFSAVAPLPTMVSAEHHLSATFHDRQHARVTILASPRDSAVSMFLFEIEPRTLQAERMMRHSYPEYGYVISGALKVLFEDEELLAEAGDSVRVDAGRPHRFINPGSALSRSVWCAPAYGAV